jgi:hypothetical protein
VRYIAFDAVSRAHHFPPLFLLLLLAGAACATTPERKKASSGLSKRASFDLDCPIRELKPVDIDERTLGVRGCGRRAVYIYVCGNTRPPGGRLSQEERECQWLRQGEVQEDAPRDRS